MSKGKGGCSWPPILYLSICVTVPTKDRRSSSRPLTTSWVTHPGLGRVQSVALAVPDSVWIP